MKRLKILLFIFCLALSIPLAYFVLLTYRSLEQEEIAQLRFFGETLFDEIEQTLAELVLTEENRQVGEYYYLPSGWLGEKVSWPPRPFHNCRKRLHPRIFSEQSGRFFPNAPVRRRHTRRAKTG